MKEADDHQWKKILGKIPSVSIPETLNSAINDQLEEIELKGLMQNLPEFSVPPDIESSFVHKFQYKFEIKYWLKIACVILLVLSSWIYISKCNKSKLQYIAIITENKEFAPFEADNIEFNWGSLKEFCAENGILCEGDKFEVLDREWILLQDAKNELLDATTIYDRESFVQNQIAYIETRQTVLINELLELI